MQELKSKILDQIDKNIKSVENCNDISKLSKVIIQNEVLLEVIKEIDNTLDWN